MPWEIYPALYLRLVWWVMAENDEEKSIDGSLSSEGDINDTDVVIGSNNQITAPRTGGGDSVARDKQTVNVNVYSNEKDKAQRKRPRRRAVQYEDEEDMITIEQKIREHLNRHDLKLERLDILIPAEVSRMQFQLDAEKRTVKDYIDDLREDVEELKKDLKPLIGLNILSLYSPKTEEEKVQLGTVRTVLAVIAIALVAIAVGIPILILFLALGGVH